VLQSSVFFLMFLVGTPVEAPLVTKALALHIRSTAFRGIRPFLLGCLCGWRMTLLFSAWCYRCALGLSLKRV
jgi:hypothetical protein